MVHLILTPILQHQQTNGQTNGQTDGQTDRQTDEKTDDHTDGQTDGQTDEQTDVHTDEHTDGHHQCINQSCLCDPPIKLYLLYSTHKALFVVLAEYLFLSF